MQQANTGLRQGERLLTITALNIVSNLLTLQKSLAKNQEAVQKRIARIQTHLAQDADTSYNEDNYHSNEEMVTDILKRHDSS